MAAGGAQQKQWKCSYSPQCELFCYGVCGGVHAVKEVILMVNIQSYKVNLHKKGSHNARPQLEDHSTDLRSLSEWQMRAFVAKPLP